MSSIEKVKISKMGDVILMRVKIPKWVMSSNEEVKISQMGVIPNEGLKYPKWGCHLMRRLKYPKRVTSSNEELKYKFVMSSNENKNIIEMGDVI
ncbi:hypothetical protein AVEN_189667-1 [Araneus ventricosus]|uniref:Uncharacterized protein n=1 Tax=Araneus ventricosus TaxID=182803 RepID=A0A4Y2M0R1_ARAVE|nr:hypothetical protein AVEN_189667-1 [Araneus ventricosus]